MTDLIPAPRPVPTTEERMRDARTDHTFATYLDRTERDQLDARAACAEQERDEALDARNVLRTQLDAVWDALAIRRAEDPIAAIHRLRSDLDSTQQVATYRQGVIDRHRQELGAAGEVLAVVRDATERIERALARYDTQPGEPAVEPDDDTDPAAVQDMLDDATRAFADAGTSSERVEVIRDLLAGWYAAWPATAVTDEHEGIAHQLVALVHAAEARAGASSVPPRRAQEDQQPLRDRVEHAIRARLDTAFPNFSRVALDQVAAVAAVAAVDTLREEPASEEIRWAYRWIGTDGQVYDEMDASDNAIETAEQRAHRIAAKRLTGTVRGEVLRYRVLTMPAEVVATYPAEATS